MTLRSRRKQTELAELGNPILTKPRNKRHTKSHAIFRRGAAACFRRFHRDTVSRVDTQQKIRESPPYLGAVLGRLHRDGHVGCISCCPEPGRGQPIRRKAERELALVPVPLGGKEGRKGRQDRKHDLTRLADLGEQGKQEKYRRPNHRAIRNSSIKSKSKSKSKNSTTNEFEPKSGTVDGRKIETVKTSTQHRQASGNTDTERSGLSSSRRENFTSTDATTVKGSQSSGHGRRHTRRHTPRAVVNRRTSRR